MVKNRKCDIPNCNEVASRKVWHRFHLNTMELGRVRYLCVGHAFILLGAEAPDDCCICPVCLTHFSVECLDGQKKIERQS